MGDRYPFRLRIHRTAAVPEGGGDLVIQNSTTLANGIVGSTYSATITSTGGSGTYTPGYTLIGSLPTGLSLSTAGVIDGTPSTNGTSTFTIHVEDDDGSTASKQFKQIVNSSGAMHAYFDSLSTRADTYLSASLRDQDTIDQYIAGSTGSNWQYDASMDAAKGVTSTSGDADIRPQLVFDFDPNFSSGSFTVIWDSYKGTEWRDQLEPPNKMFMVRNSSGSIHFEMRFHSISEVNQALFTPNGSTTTDAGFTDIRFYKALSTTPDSFASSGWYKSRDNSTGSIRTANDSDASQPQHQAVWIPFEEWHRHVIHCEMSSEAFGTDFDKWSYWVIKQGSGSTAVVEKMPGRNHGADYFALHYDNSGTNTSSFVAYERNVWIGRDLSTSDVAGLLSTESL